MTNITDVFDNLTVDPRFLKLQEIGQKIEENRSEFNLVSIFSDLLDENAWSRILAYLMDSNHPHQLQKSFIDLLLRGHVEPWVQGFRRELLSDPNIRTSVLTEWRTQNNRRVDILVKFVDLKNDVKAVIAFENKLYTAEHNMQISDYQNSLHHYFPNASKFIFFLTPGRLVSQTSHFFEQCPCHVLSYEDVMNVCLQLSLNTEGQEQILLISLKQYLQNTFNYNNMAKEINELVYELYQKPELRTAMEMIALHIPNINHVFDSLDTYFNNQKVKELSHTNVPEKPRVAFRHQYKEYKVHIRELDIYNNDFGVYPTYILCLEGNAIPKIKSKYLLRLMIHVEIFVQDEHTLLIKQEVLEKLGLSNSIGEPKHYWQWINIWVGDNYELQDLGNKDVQGLIRLIENSIKLTINELKDKIQIFKASFV